MNKHLLVTFTVAPALLLFGCGGGGAKEEAKKETTAPPAASAPPVDEASAATVTGKVAFEGPKPAVKNISMDATPACARQHTGAVKSEEVVINGNNTVKNAFVWVKAGLPDRQWPTPTAAVNLDQKTCVYSPHVIGVMVNQPIEISNSDPTNHNIHPMPKANREWNESQPPGAEKKSKTFAREELMIPVKCNVHAWMRSYISVVNHPFFAVTGDDGTFTIKGLPPGEYTIEVLHEKLAPQEMKVKVEAKDSKTVDFTLKS